MTNPETTCDHDTLSQRPLDLADWVSARLDAAGLALMSLPHRDYCLGFSRYHPEIVRQFRENYGWDGTPRHVTPPGAQAIAEMDQAISWIGWLPDDQQQLRWLVGKRMLLHPISQRRFWTWRALGDHLGISHTHVARRHAAAIAIIAGKLHRSKKTGLQRLQESP